MNTETPMQANRNESGEQSALFDVIATEIATGNKRVMERGLTLKNAEAYIQMAVMRRGVEHEFFSAVPSEIARTCQHDPTAPAPTSKPQYPDNNGNMRYWCPICSSWFSRPLSEGDAR